MLLAAYNILLALGLALLAPLAPLWILRPRWRGGLSQRLGLLPKDVRERAWLNEGSLWVHAASLGEVNAVAPVVRELAPRLPRLSLVVTCTTLAGREQARRLFPQAAACLLLPVDLPFLLRPWLLRFRPRLCVVAETELWPNLLRLMRAHGSRLVVVNGRLTERSARRYRLLGSGFAGLAEPVDLFAMQSEEDAGRLLALGVRRARVAVTGNTKFDLSGDLAPAVEGAAELRRALGWTPGPVVVAGSTRPGEEPLMLDAFRDLSRERPSLRLVLAPRHPERADELAALLERRRFRSSRRSLGKACPEAEVLLLDTLGELREFYALAMGDGLAWMGGSFKDFGGQNPLEAAALGVPVIFGPSMRHFPEVARALVDAGGALQVEPGALARSSARVLGDAKARAAMAQAAQACVREHAGASRRSADLALKLMLVARMRQDESWRGQGLEALRASTEFGAVLEDPDWRHQGPLPMPRGREFGMRLEREDDAVG